VTDDGDPGRPPAPNAAGGSDADIEVAPPAGRDAARSTRRLVHDLNNSLASIGAFAHLLRTDPALPAELQRQAELLVTETGHLRVLVEELAQVAASAGGTPPAAIAPNAEPEPDVAPSPDAPPAAAAGAAAGTTARRRPRILILDDEAAIRDILAKVLTRAGYEPIVSDSGTLALELIARDPPDAILCDHRMSGMSGVEFHAAVARIAPQLARRFAFMSGDSRDPDLRETAAAGGVHILAKPFDIATVSATVQRLLETRG
jgi:CheY-like chemotaxis protein